MRYFFFVCFIVYLHHILFLNRTFCLINILILIAAIAIPSNGFNLECEYVRSGWYVVGEVKNCYGKRMNVLVPDIEIDSVDNSTETLNDVKGFWVTNEVCKYVPKKIAMFMPNLVAFGMEKTGLKSLSRFDLEPFPNIKRFAVYGNEIDYIEKDLFIYNTKLESVSLTDNNLMIIGSTFLEPLPLLNWAQVEIKCVRRTCENRDCIKSLTSDLNINCQSDDVITKLNAKIQRLEVELKELNRKYDNAGNNIYPDFDVRVTETKKID